MCLNFWWLSQVKLRLSPCEAQSPKISLPSYYPFATIKPTRGLSRAFSCVFSACASKRPVTCTPKMWTEKQSQQTNTARWLRLNLIASPTIGGHIESYPWEPGGTGLAKRLAHWKTLRCWTAPPVQWCSWCEWKRVWGAHDGCHALAFLGVRGFNAVPRTWKKEQVHSSHAYRVRKLELTNMSCKDQSPPAGGMPRQTSCGLIESLRIQLPCSSRLDRNNYFPSPKNRWVAPSEIGATHTRNPQISPLDGTI